MRNYSTDGEGFLALGTGKRLTGCKDCSNSSDTITFVPESSLMDGDSFFSRAGTLDCIGVRISNSPTSVSTEVYNFKYLYARPDSTYNIAEALSIYHHEIAAADSIKMFLYLGYDASYIPWRRLKIWKNDVLVYDVRLTDTTGKFYPYVGFNALIDSVHNTKTTYVAWDEINPAINFGVSINHLSYLNAIGEDSSLKPYFGKISTAQAVISGTSMAPFYYMFFEAYVCYPDYSSDGYFNQTTIDGTYDVSFNGENLTNAYPNVDFNCTQHFSSFHHIYCTPVTDCINAIPSPNGVQIINAVATTNNSISLNARFQVAAPYRHDYAGPLIMFHLENYELEFGTVKLNQVNSVTVNNRVNQLTHPMASTWSVQQDTWDMPCSGTQTGYGIKSEVFDGIRVLMGGSITFHLIPEGYSL